MSLKNLTGKTVIKNIRFSYTLLKQIEQVMEKENTRNFSAWVKEACREKALQCNSSREVKKTKN
ncbi:hypothetical protein C3432_00885 [Citrobacter amalonaticus]|uniref:DUF3950 domain-containing protein n=1 Tax=Citrobacter amalonaticus TaxID=35703 RepID=A0A2S4S203_CITAM|nr:DUF3950 domain-containing protein [Citrobacter amalonaticus]POT59318.1 hypothetical protein C3432_00885 [Citrobacter amalonaticus]POT77448.1 hypothetical protein C3436_08555 [Citrobacter amalonaticus]POU67900.1 hypothetical protein C3430_02090 [Citrobacter amalonaticus]POV07504.1 hypothetical protein C3424_02100 [Citrobacter amalonaticus]